MVTAARLTSFPNCALALGEMVDSAIKVCSTPQTSIPTMGALRALTLLNSFGNMP
ncbi:hypothetical protein D3C87_1413180 [compost metagenome]